MEIEKKETFLNPHRCLKNFRKFNSLTDHFRNKEKVEISDENQVNFDYNVFRFFRNFCEDQNHVNQCMGKICG